MADTVFHERQNWVREIAANIFITSTNHRWSTNIPQQKKIENLHEFEVNECHITHLFLPHEINIAINFIQLSAMHVLYARNLIRNIFD